MVRIVRKDESDDERLDRLVAELTARHGLRLERTGWARKTYDLFYPDRQADRFPLVARVETFAAVNGEVRVYDDRGLPFAEALGAELEKGFGVKEATILRLPPPG